MNKNIIDELTNSAPFWGNLNVVLKINSNQVYFESIFKEIIGLHNPIDYRISEFNTISQEMKDLKMFEFTDDVNKNISILRVVILIENESIVLEYFDNIILIKHAINPSVLSICVGHYAIKNYFEKRKISVLILGFELFISSSLFELSLSESISDESIYPIYVIKKNGGLIIEDYFFNNKNVNEQKRTVLDKYLKLIL